MNEIIKAEGNEQGNERSVPLISHVLQKHIPNCSATYYASFSLTSRTLCTWLNLADQV